MADMTFRLDGLDDVIKRLDEAKIRAASKRGMDKGMTWLHGQVPPESSVPPPPMSTYRRTGTMLREMTTDSMTSRDNVIGIIGTHAKYAPKVIGEGMQARVHQGRWWTLQDVARKGLSTIADFIKAEVADVLGGK